MLMSSPLAVGASHFAYMREMQRFAQDSQGRQAVLISHICVRCNAVGFTVFILSCILISHICVRCNSKNYANFIAPLFNFCCIRSHVCSEMALSPLMERDFWCEPLGIFMCTYVSHPVRICEPWLCQSATSAHKCVLR